MFFLLLHVFFSREVEALVGLEYQRELFCLCFLLGWGGLEMKRNKVDKSES